jgi:biopolymer transport protein ExbD
MDTGGKRGDVKSDINVTPLVDIVLVLLIIFLVTMPVLMKHITIEIPRELDADEAPPSNSRQITVIASLDNIIVNDGVSDTTINRVDLAKTLRPLLEKKRDEKLVFVGFADDVPYDTVISIMDTIKGAGAEKLALKIRDKNVPVQ